MTKLTAIPNPLVSVIVPTYNRAYCLGRAIKSVIDQTYPHWEMIIVDNHSADNTDELIAIFDEPKINLIKIHNKGVIAASRNNGLHASHGKYVAFLDSDDWWLPKKLEKSVQALESGADLVYHDLFLMPPDAEKPKFWKKAKTRSVKAPVFRDLLVNGSAICNSSVVVKRKLIQKIGGFSEDPELIAAEDYDAWLRVAKLTNSYFRLRDCLGYYTVGADNISGAECSLVNVKRLLELYENEIEKLRVDVPAWMCYLLGSSYYKRHIFGESKKYLQKVFLKFCPALWIRAAVILSIIFLKTLLSKKT